MDAQQGTEQKSLSQFLVLIIDSSFSLFLKFLPSGGSHHFKNPQGYVKL